MTPKEYFRQDVYVKESNVFLWLLGMRVTDNQYCFQWMNMVFWDIFVSDDVIYFGVPNFQAFITY